MKRRIALVGVALALTLTGCAGTAEQSASEAQDAAQTTQSQPTETPEAQKMSAANSSDNTEPGEVCDPGNGNDAICAAFYPDQLVLNMADRAGGAFSELSDAEQIALAHDACANLDAGTQTALVADEQGNSLAYKAGSVAYCTEHAGGPDDMPDMIARLVTFYQGLGEADAKAHFAGGSMPTPAELGY